MTDPAPLTAAEMADEIAWLLRVLPETMTSESDLRLDRAVHVIRQQAARIALLWVALRPFAMIEPSSAFADGDDELYIAVLSPFYQGDFRRSDLERARKALAP